jgi:HSP20 family protein
MAIVRWDPWREIADRFDRYTREVGQPQAGSQDVIATGDWAPRVDIAKTDEAFVIKAEIPGVNKEDVKVTVDNGVLTIRGERKQEKEEKGKKFHRVERYYGTFTGALRCLTMSMKAKSRLRSRTAYGMLQQTSIP